MKRDKKLCNAISGFITNICALVSRNKVPRKEKLKKKQIYPLSPDYYIDKNDLFKSEYKVYEKQLKTVFKTPSMQNIAITGDFGIGKSSVIKTFDRKNERNVFKRNNKFLYISVDNLRVDYYKEAIKGGTANDIADCLETDLLRQILYTCDRNEVPDISYKLISKRQSTVRRVFIPTFALFMLLLSLEMALFYDKVNSAISLISYTTIQNWWRNNSSNMLFAAYLVLAICAGYFAVCLGISFFSIANSIHFSVFGEKELPNDNKVGAAIELDGGHSYLDKHAFELIYALERTASKYNWTIVFEDMDRIEPDSPQIQRSIFAELREINQLVNTRLELNYSTWVKRIGMRFPPLLRMSIFRPNVLRFLYVSNGCLFDSDECVKFFDYVMPVVPAIHLESLLDRIVAFLKDLEIDLKESDPEERLRPSVLLKNAFPCLNDYRTMHTIANEYKLFAEIETERDLLTDRIDKIQLFIFVTYKTLFPKDYYAIRKGTSIVFHNKTEDEDEFISKGGSALLWDWIVSGLLTTECLLFCGYSLNWLKEYYSRSLLSGSSDEKKDLFIRSVLAHSKQRQICIDLLLEYDQSMFRQVMDGVQAPLLIFILDSFSLVYQAKNTNKINLFCEKTVRILEKAIEPQMMESELHDVDMGVIESKLSNCFWLFSDDARKMILKFLVINKVTVQNPLR